MKHCWYILLGISMMSAADESPIAIALHGGAGTIERGAMSEELEATYRAFLDDAITQGYEQLREGRSGLDVVVTVIQMMEDSPLFNAGRGAVYTWDGTHELDASIMHGEKLDAGAVAGVGTVQSPIALARAVMEDSPHVMLAGPGAEAFAQEQGYDPVSPEYFGTERRREALRDRCVDGPWSSTSVGERAVAHRVGRDADVAEGERLARGLLAEPLQRGHEPAALLVHHFEHDAQCCVTRRGAARRLFGRLRLLRLHARLFRLHAGAHVYPSVHLCCSCCTA